MADEIAEVEAFLSDAQTKVGSSFCTNLVNLLTSSVAYRS